MVVDGCIRSTWMKYQWLWHAHWHALVCISEGRENIIHHPGGGSSERRRIHGSQCLYQEYVGEVLMAVLYASPRALVCISEGRI